MTQTEAGASHHLTRREVIRRTATAGAVAWTAPLIVDSLASPAAAATCPPGQYNVVYQTALTPRTPIVAAGCLGTGTNLPTAAQVALMTGLTATGGPITHVASTAGNFNPVVLRISTGCSCYITSVRAHVHRRGAPTNPDCPNPACQTASTAANAALRITAGALGSGTVTVAPNYNSNLCGNVGVHWGSPGQPNGYMVVNITCG